MNKAEKEALIERFVSAYKRVSGCPCPAGDISVHHYGTGWYTILREGADPKHAIHKFRIAELERMSVNLEERADELEGAAKRKGFVLVAASPNNDTYRHATSKYMTEDNDWLHDKKDPAIRVFESASGAAQFADELNINNPFPYITFEPY